ncbi:MAG: hypothetical protein H0T46_33800 [Deltaproteobacteria bacterium]|nr:hypothetical protein [Deltaproteobacteria bacterium]
MRTLVVSLSLLLFAACGSKAADKPANGSGSAGSATTTGSAGSAGSAAEAPIVLPKGDGTPPKKTTAKLTDPDFKRLAAIDHPPFLKRIRNTQDGMDVRFTTPRPKIGTTVTITPCFTCPPMTLEKWKEREDTDLKFLIGEDLRMRPDTTWEMGTVDLKGQTLVYTHHVGHFFGNDEAGNPHASYANSYALYYNDGVNQIRVVSEYQDAPVPREQMVAVAPKEDLARLALAFLDFYTHAW